MENTTEKKGNLWIRAIGLGILALFLTFFLYPKETHAFNIFNGDGYDGYFLSLTNDPTNVRIVPVAIYDNHPKKQKSTAFIEWVDVEVNYGDYDYNGKPLPEVKGGDDNREKWVKEVRKNDGDMHGHSKLGWTFPGFAGEKDALTYNASQADLDRALWVSDTLVAEFNQAISMVHKSVQEYGNKDLANMSSNQFANMIRIIANAARKAQTDGSSSFSYHGVTFNVKNGVTNGSNIRPPKGVPKDAYVTFTLDGHSDVTKAFIEYVPKGYRKDKHGRADMQPMYDSLNKTFKDSVEDSEDLDLYNLNWMLVALQSNSNWSARNVTFTNIGDIMETSKFEQFITDTASNLLAGLRQMLGLYSSSDLIMNGGTRGTDSYYKGIMPHTWMQSADVLHWISYAVAWMLIIGAIVKLFVQRNLAAINPSERVDMINGIKNLMIVGFALSVFDLAFAGITEINYLIVEMLASSGTGIEQFGQAPVSSGMLASIVVGVVFFIFDIYFNFFYIARALMVAILYAVGPLYVASIAFGEKYRQIFGNYVKELIGNVFVQSFQAILVVFFAGISIFGNLRTIETMVLLFCFIPMTRFFKESIGASSSASDAMTNTALGATGTAVAGALFSKKGNGGKKGGSGAGGGSGEGGSDIRTKSGSSFGGNSTGGGPKATAKSMIGHGVKAVGKGAMGVGKATVGAGLVAGGAATGMSGASALGGAMMGSGFGNMNNARKEVGVTGENAMKGAKTVGKGVVKGANKVIDHAATQTSRGASVAAARDMGKNTLDKMSPNAQAAKRHKVVSGSEGQPTPENVQTMKDGSSVQTFNKSDYSENTGIVSMKDTDNQGNEMEIGTNYVPGQGFVGSSSDLNGSAYQQKMGDISNAFQNQDTAQMAKYQEQGIMGMKVDKNTGRASFVVDKNRAGLGDVYNSGDNIHIQRKVRSNDPNQNRKYANGHANPFSNIF